VETIDAKGAKKEIDEIRTPDKAKKFIFSNGRPLFELERLQKGGFFVWEKLSKVLEVELLVMQGKLFAFP